MTQSIKSPVVLSTPEFSEAVQLNSHRSRCLNIRKHGHGVHEERYIRTHNFPKQSLTVTDSRPSELFTRFLEMSHGVLRSLATVDQIASTVVLATHEYSEAVQLIRCRVLSTLEYS